MWLGDFRLGLHFPGMIIAELLTAMQNGWCVNNAFEMREVKQSYENWFWFGYKFSQVLISRISWPFAKINPLNFVLFPENLEITSKIRRKVYFPKVFSPLIHKQVPRPRWSTVWTRESLPIMYMLPVVFMFSCLFVDFSWTIPRVGLDGEMFKMFPSLHASIWYIAN